MVAASLVGAPMRNAYDSAVVSWLEAIVLGIAQGLTEFLPISSTAHLRIVPAFAGWEDPGAFFTAVVQLGTMLAVVIYFWRDLLRIVGPGSSACAGPSCGTSWTPAWGGT